MRIRSIKPEFWRSEDIAGLEWCDRLLFIGLWSYVDDNGVGRDSGPIITADLFALEDDPRDTLATVSRGLQKLSEAGLITRYEANGKRLLFITKWDQHQRIDKPAKARNPRPTSGSGDSRDTLATSSGDVPDLLAPGTGEQGNRGTGNPGLSLAVPHQDEAQPRDKQGRFLGGEWVNTPKVCGQHPDEELSKAGKCRWCEADRKAVAS